MLRVMLSTGNIFFSFMLGLLACAFVIFNYPYAMDTILGWAGEVESWLTNLGFPPEYNNWLQLLLNKGSLVVMGFTMAARLAISLVTSTFMWMFGRGGAQ